MNVAVTYPPRKVNGLLVSGLLTPPLANVTYTYPPGLRDEIDKVADGYEIIPWTPNTDKNHEEKYQREVHRVLTKRIQVARYLIRQYPWDFFMVVFFVTDTMQHFFWHHLDQDHPKHDPEAAREHRDMIKDCYKAVDQGIGELLSAVPGEANTIIVSDHGFGPLYGQFSINEWLRKNGWLKLKARSRSSWERTLESIGLGFRNRLFKHVDIRVIRSIARRIPSRISNAIIDRMSHFGQFRSGALDLLEQVDWVNTTAYALGEMGGIFINTANRGLGGTVRPEEHDALKAQITESLYRVEHPLTGDRVVDRVYTKEELYHGKYLDWAPDLLYVLDDFKYVPKVSLGDADKLWSDHRITGWHRLHGVFLAHGPDIKKGVRIDNASIYDIAPTILQLSGVPIPFDMDGRVLTEILDEASAAATRPAVHMEMAEKMRIRARVRGLRGSARL